MAKCPRILGILQNSNICLWIGEDEENDFRSTAEKRTNKLYKKKENGWEVYVAGLESTCRFCSFSIQSVNNMAVEDLKKKEEIG